MGRQGCLGAFRTKGHRKKHDNMTEGTRESALHGPVHLATIKVVFV